MSTTPFDFLKSINTTKCNLIRTSDNPELMEKEYAPYIVNRGLSLFQDTIMFANEMNRLHALPKIMQYEFYLNIVRKRKRYSKWHKPKEDHQIQVISDYYGFSMERAKDYIGILSDDDITELESRMNTGGLNKNKKDSTK
jgi:hypothetical protein